jgi:hypothetical protein
MMYEIIDVPPTRTKPLRFALVKYDKLGPTLVAGPYRVKSTAKAVKQMLELLPGYRPKRSDCA